MPINPNIPLSIQRDRTGDILLGGVQRILADRETKKQRGIENERQNRLIQLQENKLADERAIRVEQNVAKSVATTYQNELEGLYNAKDFEGISRILEGKAQASDPRTPEGQAWGAILERHTQDPEGAGVLFRQTTRQAEFDKLVPGKAKGTRRNVQIPGEPIRPGIETPEGFIEDPATGERIPEAIIAPSRQATGGTEDFGLGAAGENIVDKKLINIGEGLARLERMEGQFDPKFLQIAPRLSSLISQGKEKLGVKLSPEDEKELTAFSKFKTAASDNLNKHIKEATGAQMSESEVGRLKQAVPVPGTGLFDGDSPTVYKAKLSETIATLKAAQRRMLFLKKNGFEGRPSEAIADKFPLDDFRVSPEKEEDAVMQEARAAVKQGADIDAVNKRLREMGKPEIE